MLERGGVSKILIKCVTYYLDVPKSVKTIEYFVKLKKMMKFGI